MLADIRQYLLDLADNWGAIMTGGIPVAVLAVWERWRGRTIPLKFYLLLFLGVGFAAASFQTWRHEYATRVLAELMSFKGRNPETVRRLLNYYMLQHSTFKQPSLNLMPNLRRRKNQ